MPLKKSMIKAIHLLKQRARFSIFPNQGTQWAGVRADCGVAAEGLWAFCVWNETGGNLRIGWSMENSKLALGTVPWKMETYPLVI